MQSGALFIAAVVVVCLASVPGVPSAESAVTTDARPAPARAAASVSPVLFPGPGYGGNCRGPCEPARFLGVTTRLFPVGVGALVASQACNDEHPYSRLCEWKDLFRAIPPPVLPSDVLVARNYETNPMTSCLTPGGGLYCRPLRLPAACCGSPAPVVSPISTLILSGGDQSILDCSDTFQFTAVALDLQGLPVAGALVSFAFLPVVGGTNLIVGTFTPATGITDLNGEVSTTLSLDLSACDTYCRGGHDCSAPIEAIAASGAIHSSAVLLVDAIP